MKIFPTALRFKSMQNTCKKEKKKLCEKSKDRYIFFKFVTFVKHVLVLTAE